MVRGAAAVSVRSVSSPAGPTGSAAVRRARGSQVPAHERAIIERAARRGPVPEDDGQRQAALRLVEDRLLTLQATRTRAAALPAVLALLTGVLAVTRSPWWWVAVAAAVALVVAVLLMPRRLQRRADLLRRGG